MENESEGLKSGGGQMNRETSATRKGDVDVGDQQDPRDDVGKKVT